jgi:hypothetical protein
MCLEQGPQLSVRIPDDVWFETLHVVDYLPLDAG